MKAMFLIQMSHPKDKSGPCEWKITDRGDARKPVIAKGVCKTYKQAKGETTRISNAIHKAYKIGVRHGVHRQKFSIANVDLNLFRREPEIGSRCIVV
jgi:hypothetical protein